MQWKLETAFLPQAVSMADEVVIVEFGSNKNCRIPMKKGAIVEVEKANEQ